MKAILIGAGKIGRGFIGQVLDEAGYSLTFVDASESLVAELNRYGKYPVRILGADEREITITNFRAYGVGEPDAVREFTEASIVTTAVGPSVLPRTAPYIAEGIKERYARNITSPLTVIACENMIDGTTVLFHEVEKLLTPEERDYCSRYVGFPDAEVSRMVIPTEDPNPLAVKVEQYMEWVIDRSKVKDDLTSIQNLELTDQPDAYIKRKIFSLTGHAMLAYLGYKKGYEFICESAYDDAIFETVYRALAECGKGWSAEYGLPAEDFNLYITIMLRRFSDPRLKDPIRRVGHQPIRKLARGERFIGPALACMKHGIEPAFIVEGIMAALDYDDPDDEQAGRLQAMLRQEGIERVLETVCGLTRNEPLFGILTKAYKGRQGNG